MIRRVTIIALMCCVMVSAIVADARIYPIKNITVYDGDTIVADIYLGFGLVMQKQRIRFGIADAPEIKTTNKYEKRAGLLVTEVVTKLFKENTKQVYLSTDDTDERGNFGRPMGKIYLGTFDLSKYLLDKGLAIVYPNKYKQEDFIRIIKQLSPTDPLLKLSPIKTIKKTEQKVKAHIETMIKKSAGTDKKLRPIATH